MTDNYAPARWAGAPLGNYGAGRPGGIDLLIIHDTEGSYQSAINRFTDPTEGVSAHYVFRSSDGDVTQCVHEADTGYHCGNLRYNERSIGIEHEGFRAHPDIWYTDTMLTASARLVTMLCARYSIPIDRQHIIGHAEVPSEDGTHFGGNDYHTDPGPGWPWDRYMQMVNGTVMNNHLVPSDFLTYWENNGGLSIFGYPMSEVITYQGLRVQIFERARFERQTSGVVLGRVGAEWAELAGIHISLHSAAYSSGELSGLISRVSRVRHSEPLPITGERDMFSGVYAPNRHPFNTDDQHLLMLARPQAAILRYNEADGARTHDRADADYLRGLGCEEFVLVVDPDRLDLHYEAVAATVQEFGPRVTIQLGNEPDSEANTIAKMWQLRYYLMLILSQRILYPTARLLPPPLRCTPRNIQPQLDFLHTPLGNDSLFDLYQRFDALAIHVYDYWEASYLLELVVAWHAAFPTRQIYVTEYGIDGTLDPAEKVRRYRQFVTGCRLLPYVSLTAMFIAGSGLPGGFAHYEVGNAVAGLAGA